MKKNILLGIIIAVVVILLGINFYTSKNSQATDALCAKVGEKYSHVYKDEYPENCCEGLKEWESGMDTRISIAGKCYDSGMLSGSPIGTCIDCGNNRCDTIENVCNCPEDCDASKSDYATVEEFCEGEDGIYGGYSRICGEGNPMMLPVCDLCQ
jgi:hypothetical protein